MHMLHSSSFKSGAPRLAFASARLMALRRLVATTLGILRQPMLLGRPTLLQQLVLAVTTLPTALLGETGGLTRGMLTRLHVI